MPHSCDCFGTRSPTDLWTARGETARKAGEQPECAAQSADPRSTDTTLAAKAAQVAGDWQEISLSGVLAVEPSSGIEHEGAEKRRPKILDGEIVDGPPVPSAPRSELADDPLLVALDDELEGLVELVDSPAALAASRKSPSTSDLASSTAEESWLLSTIGRLREDLGRFQKPGESEGEIKADRPALGTVSADSPAGAESDRIQPGTPRHPAEAAGSSHAWWVLPRPRSQPGLPLDTWAHRVHAPNVTSEPATPPEGLDDADGLLRGLLLPERVAHITYPSGCRIQRVRVAARNADQLEDEASEAPVVILSKQAIGRDREQSITT